MAYPIVLRMQGHHLTLSQPDLWLYRGLGPELPSPQELGKAIYDFWSHVYSVGKKNPIQPAQRFNKAEWLSVKDVAHIIGLSPSTVRRLCNSGVLETQKYRTGKKHRKIHRDSVHRYLKGDTHEIETKARSEV